jgi:hypothetical protein
VLGGRGAGEDGEVVLEDLRCWREGRGVGLLFAAKMPRMGAGLVVEG